MYYVYIAYVKTICNDHKNIKKIRRQYKKHPCFKNPTKFHPDHKHNYIIVISLQILANFCKVT